MTFKIKRRPEFKEMPLERVNFTLPSYKISITDLINKVKECLENYNRYHNIIQIPEELSLNEIMVEAEIDYYDYGDSSTCQIEITYEAKPSQTRIDEHKQKFLKKLEAYEKWRVDNAAQIDAEMKRREQKEIIRKKQEKINRRAELEEEIRRAQEKLDSL